MATIPAGTRKPIAPEMVTSTWVGSGSVPPRSANMFSKIGTMNSSMPTHISAAMISTTTG